MADWGTLRVGALMRTSRTAAECFFLLFFFFREASKCLAAFGYVENFFAEKYIEKRFFFLNWIVEKKGVVLSVNFANTGVVIVFQTRGP